MAATSILDSVKKNLGLAEDYEAFDADVILYINSVLSTLNQLGVGPEEGFQIEDRTATWSAVIGTSPKWNFVKSWLYLKVRLLFDPPTTSYLITALNDQARELEWRISEHREELFWVPPVVTEPAEDDIIDGGTP